MPEPANITEDIMQVIVQLKHFYDNPHPNVVTDDAVSRCVDSIAALLRSAELGAQLDFGPDRSQNDNLRAELRRLLSPGLAGATWLSKTTKTKLERFLAICPEHIVRGRYKFTYDCFSSRASQWERDLGCFRDQPSLHFLEIGSFEGHSACWLLDNILTHPTSDLTCIDLFQPPWENLFEHNIAQSGAQAKVKRIVGYSQRVLPSLPCEFYDFIYVDGSHEQVDVLEDAIFGWRLLKSGGVMTMDDYGLRKSRMPYTVRPERGIDAFLNVYEKRYKLIHRGYQITIQKL